jgi:hypothetical protein
VARYCSLLRSKLKMVFISDPSHTCAGCRRFSVWPVSWAKAQQGFPAAGVDVQPVAPGLGSVLPSAGMESPSAIFIASSVLRASGPPGAALPASSGNSWKLSLSAASGFSRV